MGLTRGCSHRRKRSRVVRYFLGPNRTRRVRALPQSPRAYMWMYKYKYVDAYIYRVTEVLTVENGQESFDIFLNPTERGEPNRTRRGLEPPRAPRGYMWMYKYTVWMHTYIGLRMFSPSKTVKSRSIFYWTQPHAESSSTTASVARIYVDV